MSVAALMARVGAFELEERERRRFVDGMRRARATALEVLGASREDLMDSAYGYCHRRCLDTLRLDLGDALLRHGTHALELQRAWLAEWRAWWLDQLRRRSAARNG